MGLTRSKVQKLFDYHPHGYLIWKPNPKRLKWWNTRYANKRAGRLREDGYTNIAIDGKTYFEHRLIFMYHHGYFPTQVDHKNRNPGDSRIENLRAATPAQNQHNSAKSKRNTSGYKGVHFNKRRKKWEPQIRVMGARIWLGRYDNIEDAAARYREAAIQYHGEFARLD